MKTPPNPGLRRIYVNLKKANWDRYRQEVEAVLSKRSPPTDCQRDEKIFCTVLLKAASHHIPTGRHRLHEEAVPTEILDVMNRRDDLRKRDPISPELPRLNKTIQNRICVHKRQKWRDFVETMDQKTDVTKLWRTIKGIDGRAKRVAENEAITFSSSKQLATKFNQQFNTSKLGRHTSSRETRVMTRETKRKPLEMVRTWTCFRGVKSTSRKVNTGVPQGSKLSPSLFSFYIADMPIPTEPVKRVCYADDLTVWASGVNIPDLEVSINNYLEEITAYVKDNSLLISASKSSVTLLTPYTHQAKIHPRIFIDNSHLPLVKYPRILGVYLDPSLSFNKHSQYVAERVSGRNNILKALAGTSWGQQKETLLMTYKAVGRSIINYASPVWSPNLHDTNYRKIHYTQNEALRITKGCHKMSSIDHLHTEAEMLKVREHSELLSAQYLARCLELGNVCHPITTMAIPERQMKETLYTRHRNTVDPMMVENDRKATLQALHTAAVV